VALVTATNSSLPNVIEWATSGSDRFVRQKHLAGVTENFDAHDHSAGKGLPVARLASGTPATNGQVTVNGDDLQWFGTALQTAVRLAGAQMVTGQKSFALPVVSSAATGQQVTVGNIGGGAPGVAFGLAGDTSIYRAATDLLKTDDAFLVASNALTVEGTAPRLTVTRTAVAFGDYSLVPGAADTTDQCGLYNNRAGRYEWYTAPSGVLTAAVGLATPGQIAVGGAVVLTAGKTVTQKSAVIPLNSSAGAFATIFTVPANSYGVLHVSSTCPNGPSRTYQQVMWVSDATGLFVNTSLAGTAISGASGSNLSFTATGLNIQARGASAFTPDGCKVWAEYAAIGTGG
jgi:hypothetical protein